MQKTILLERCREAHGQALKHVKAAEHLVTVSYPLTHDAKLLLGAVEDIFLACTSAMTAVLQHDRTGKLVPPFNNTFDGKYVIFRERCMPRYKFNRNCLTLMQELKELVMMHQKCPVEFRRKDCYVLCDKSYNTKTVTLQHIKEYIKHCKSFLAEAYAATELSVLVKQE